MKDQVKVKNGVKGTRAWEKRSAQDIIDNEVILTIPMLARIWNINISSAWRRLTKRNGLYHRFAYKDERQWCIWKVDFVRVRAQARGKSEIIKEHIYKVIK